MDVKAFLDEKVIQYNQPFFIESDPIQIPHAFQQKEDIEIAGFLAATIAWGKRTSIISSAKKLMELMGNSPYDFVMLANEMQLERISDFKYRTFQPIDLHYFITSLKNIYTHHGGLETVFTKGFNAADSKSAITHFHNTFFHLDHPQRTQKHVSNPAKGAAAKRINMYLRWMVRQDNKGVDFGLWKKIAPAKLSCPLDVHSGRVARKLGLLNRKQDDWKAVNELDTSLKALDSKDPSKYDFALFGLGIFEGF
ncbi:MAG: hypothetical protein ACI8P7_001145 [Candidatus Azotimanducaceae bacterium]|jgi:uncharacterized protein (TIGR02757 family)